MAIVYLITNKITNKSYVGHTIHTVEGRWAAHVYAASKPKSESKFHKAIRKYDKSSWEFTILEEANQEFISEKERYWIKKLDSHRNGYNGSIGGESSKKRKETKYYIDPIDENLLSHGIFEDLAYNFYKKRVFKYD